MHRRRFIMGIAAFAAALPAAPFPVRSATLSDLTKSLQTASPGIFRTIEFKSKSFKALPQWRRVLDQVKQEQKAFQSCTNNAANCSSEVQKSWREIIISARNLNRQEKLRAVNRYFNRWPYKFDQEVFGVNEYWASPVEFMTRSGDCEDFSIAKYFALKELGFSEQEMRVVIVMDRIRNIGHAILAIYEKNDILVLDSLSNVILSHSKYKHYLPQYSMNETTRWAHFVRQ
ncbi:transglutaminase-like cysteine peptidase [Pelagibius sp. Alg239-R121]|uniref:transglutaminase-like cysteine peptidase n=1 Tax=Pelagibius sp. Alg239-R121 TaxID=2993448 RepID=UPI0024A6AC8F|nr:transglutaminase-like cysteine peptidase [Pelagibius sp. Alg239-R121]